MGNYTTSRDSTLYKEYDQHGFKFAMIGSKSISYPYCIPIWLASIDAAFYRSGTEPCSLCIAMHVYNNESLRIKWSTLIALNAQHAIANKEELLEDLKLAGHRDFGCSVEVEEHNVNTPA